MEELNSHKEDKIIYNSDFIPQPGWSVHKTNSRITQFRLGDVKSIGWTNFRTTDIHNHFNDGADFQIPFNLSVLYQLMQKGLIFNEWIDFLRSSLPKRFTEHIVKDEARALWSHEDSSLSSNVQRIVKMSAECKEDSTECIAFIGTVYLNQNNQECVPALYMKANQELAIKYICPDELWETSGLSHAHGFYDKIHNLPSVVSCYFLELK